MKRLILFAFTVVLALSMTACITINVTPQGDSSSQPVENTQPTNSSEKNSSLPQTNSDTDKQDESQQPAAQQPQQSYEELEQLYSIWSQLVGYWNAAENRFALVDMMDSHTACFADGMWETEYYRECIVAQLYKDGEQQLWAVINTDGTQENVLIDYSGIEQDGKIRIKIGEDEWRQYMFAGNTMDEAYQTYCDNTYGG